MSTVKILTVALLHSGVEGDSNALCFRIASDIVRRSTINALAVISCRGNSDCFYGECTQERCTTPALSCQTSVPGKTHSPVQEQEESVLLSFPINNTPLLPSPPLGSVCSGHGTCSYLDPSGATLPSCTILDTGCRAKCVCASGFGGVDCSLTKEEFVVKSNLRYGCYVSSMP